MINAYESLAGGCDCHHDDPCEFCTEYARGYEAALRMVLNRCESEAWRVSDPLDAVADEIRDVLGVAKGD